MKNIIKQAKRFNKKAGGIPTFEKAKKFIEEKGYAVILFDKSCDEIKIYSLQDIAAKRDAFIYSDNVRIVFIKKSLDEYTKLTHLLHEIGHIVLGHLDNEVLRAETKEHEANAFAYYAFQGLPKMALSTKVLIATLAVLLCASLICNAILLRKTYYQTKPTFAVSDQNSNNEVNSFYVTPSGAKYHTKECQYAATGSPVTKEYAASNYTPCGICKPE